LRVPTPEGAGRADGEDAVVRDVLLILHIVQKKQGKLFIAE